MKVSTENDNNFGYEKITIVVDNKPLKWIDEFIEEISVFVRVVVLYIGYWIILAGSLNSCLPYWI